MTTTAPLPELAQVVADIRGDAAVLRRHAQGALADRMEEIADKVADASDEYTTWLGELACAHRSGWKVETVRRWCRKFGDSPHVRWTKGVGYEIRACLVPRRAEAAIIAASAQRKAS